MLLKPTQTGVKSTAVILVKSIFQAFKKNSIIWNAPKLKKYGLQYGILSYYFYFKISQDRSSL